MADELIHGLIERHVARTWIVHRVVKDKRCSGGVRWVAIGWVCQASETQAKREAHKIFGRFDEEDLKLVATETGYGFLV